MNSITSRSLTHILLAGVSPMLLVLAATPAAARSDDPKPTPAADAPQDDAAKPADKGLGDIVVTATRVSESSKNVPVAVTSISGDKLDVLNSGGLDIRFLSSHDAAPVITKAGLTPLTQ